MFNTGGTPYITYSKLSQTNNILTTAYEAAPKYLFDGTDDVIAITDDADLDFIAGQDFYIAVACKPYDVTRETDYLINKETGGVGYGLYIDEDDLYIRIDDGTDDGSGLIASSVFKNNTVAIVVVNFDRSGNASAYINGKKVGVLDISDVALTIANAGNFHIGQDSAGTGEFYGEISYVAVGDYLLSETEIVNLSTYLSLPYTHTGATQDELISETNDRTFAGASNWTNVDVDAYDETTDLTLTASAADQYVTLGVAYAPTTVGKRYTMSFDVANLVETWTIKSFDGTQTIGTVSAEGTGQTLTWVATTTGGFRIVAAADTSSADFDNFSMEAVGCVLELNGSSIGHSMWENINGNDCQGYVTGALPLCLPLNHSEKYIKKAIADDTTFTLPAGYMIDAIVLDGSGAIGGGIDIGTTDGGAEIVAAEAIGAAGTFMCTLVAGGNYNTTGADDTIYVTDADGTGWDSETINLYVKMSRMVL